MKVGEFKVRHGGLMRCCLATLEDHADEEVPANRLLPCDYERDKTPKLRLANDDVWEWTGV